MAEKPQDMSDLSREDVTSLSALVADLKTEIKSSVGQAVKDQSQRWRNVFIGMGIGLVLALGGAGLGLWAANEASNSADDLEVVVEDLQEVIARQESDLLQRRIDACERDNVTREASRLSNQTAAQSATSFASILVGDEEIDAELADRLARFQEQVVDPFLRLADPDTGPFKSRDCTPSALMANSNGATAEP